MFFDLSSQFTLHHLYQAPCYSSVISIGFPNQRFDTCPSLYLKHSFPGHSLEFLLHSHHIFTHMAPSERNQTYPLHHKLHMCSTLYASCCFIFLQSTHYLLTHMFIFFNLVYCVLTYQRIRLLRMGICFVLC